MKKLGLLVMIFSVLLFISWCNTSKDINKNLWDDTWYKKCTIEQKNATACDMLGNVVCGDNGQTYDNECLACASNEIDGYVSWPCNPTCDAESETCDVNLEDRKTMWDDSPTQSVWLELIVVSPEE